MAGETAAVPGSSPADLGDLADHLFAGEVAACAGLGALAELEVEGLRAGNLVERVPEPARRQLVEVSSVGFLLRWEHAALTGADAGTGKVSATSQRDLGLLRERPEAHVGDEERDLEVEWPVGVGADDDVGGDRVVVEQRSSGDCAVTNWMSSQDGRASRGTPIAPTGPW